MSRKNNHYFIGGKKYVISKIVADVIDAEIERLKKAIDTSHAVYDRLLADYQALLKESEEE